MGCDTLKEKSHKNRRLDAAKFCFGMSPNLCEGGLKFLIEEDADKRDEIADKFVKNFLRLSKSSLPFFPSLMGAIPKNMKLIFQSASSKEELQNIYRAFNHFTQVFENVVVEILEITSSETDDDLKLKRALEKRGEDLKEIIKLNFIPDKSSNKKFDTFTKRLAGYLGSDYPQDDNPGIFQKILAAAIDSFTENPTTASGTDSNLKIIFGGQTASRLMYNDLSRITVGRFREGTRQYFDEFNTVAGSVYSEKIESPSESGGSETGTGSETGGSEERDSDSKEAGISRDSEGKNLWDMMISKKTKNFRKTKIDPKAKDIKKRLDSLSSNWSEIKANPDEKYKLNFLKDIKSLRDSLADVKLEGKNLKSQDLIVESWIKIAGLED